MFCRMMESELTIIYTITMLGFDTVFEFSRHHCVAVCAFLVPANLLTTLITLLLLFLKTPVDRIRIAASFATIFAFSLFLHICTWLMIGVITPVTFILFGLGTMCLSINISALIYSQKWQNVLAFLTQMIAKYSTKLARSN